MTDIDTLYARHRQGIFRFLCRMVGQTDAAQDLTQEVFLRVSRSPVPETTEIGTRAWLYRIARNLALNHVRDGRRRPQLIDVTEVLGGDVRGTAATQDLAIALANAVASLDATDRDVFLLRESVGLGYDEIAEACEITLGAVRSRLHRARLQLRVELAGNAAGATHVKWRP